MKRLDSSIRLYYNVYVIKRESDSKMYYENQIKDLLLCSQDYASRIYAAICHLDLSEMSQETFMMEVAIATNFVEANEGDL